jgi:HD superfamily phosphohydrolase
MATKLHEIRDPIHVFIRLSSNERKALDSYPLQRLRHIHQLATTFLVYPGATHKRFEHSLGVMDLADRVYTIVTNPANIHHEAVRTLVPAPSDFDHQYWRLVLRMAALCHDVGHLPFSHASEELLPKDWNHELLTVEIIRSPQMQEIWDVLNIKTEHVAKLAVGPKKYKDGRFTVWEAILSEIVVGDAFGVDRMDYLLRDSHHTGVAYGKFDHYRLIDTLRILPKEQNEEGGSEEPTLGIEEGGFHSAEALLIARYFMFTQLYLHHVRRIYDIHLMDFLLKWRGGKKFPVDVNHHLALTDNEVIAALLVASCDKEHPGHDPARRIIRREHFKRVYESDPADKAINPEAAEYIYKAAIAKYGDAAVRLDKYTAKGNPLNFPVMTHGKRIVSFANMSNLVNFQPPISINYVFIDPNYREDAEKWIHANRRDIITPEKGEEDAKIEAVSDPNIANREP